DDAVRIAAAHPDKLMDYINTAGGHQLRAFTAAHATPLFDEVLEAAAAEFATFAPSSPRFLRASLIELQHLAESLPEIAENTRHTREAIDRLETIGEAILEWMDRESSDKRPPVRLGREPWGR